MKFPPRLLPLLALGVACPGTAQTLPLGRVPNNVVIEVLEDPYEVRGETVGQVQVGLRAEGRGRRWYTYRWRFEWNFEQERVDNGPRISSSSSATDCQTKKITVRLLFTARFPRWKRPENPDPKLVEAWEEFDSRLRAHWEEHRDVAIEATTGIIRKMDRLKAACPIIFREARSLVDDVMEEYQGKQVAFDRDGTRAPWPPSGFEREEAPAPAPPAAPPAATPNTAPDPQTGPPSPPTPATAPNVDPKVYVGPPVARDIFGAVRRDVGVAGSSGLVVGLYHRGSLNYLEAFGTPEPESEVVLLPTDMFAFPALTEFLLGTTIHALDAAGVLDIDAPISIYLPGIDAALSNIRLRQLLTHRAGLDNARVRDSVSWARTLDRLDRRAMFTEPGTIYSQSRYSFPLAMRVAEAAVGVPFSELVKASILEPLGMDSTTFDPAAARELGLSDTFTWPEKRDFTEEDTPASTIEALPVTFTNVPDVLKLLTTWVEGGISGLSPVRSGGTRHFDGGVWWDEVEGMPRVQRICQAVGFGAGLLLFPETKTVAVLWGVANWPAGTARFLLDQLRAELDLGPAIFGTGDWGGNATIGEPLVRCQEGQAPPRALLPPDAGPVPTGDWAGRYFNGDRLLELVDRSGSLVFNNAGDPMDMVHFLDDIYFTTVADLPMFPLELLVDGKGRRYVRMGGRAYIHADDRLGRK
jgi:CubicO group peptidase (beta-lactamase class C family)